MKPRTGYTLLEVLLSLGIATLLLAGLYVSMDIQLRLAQAGRDKIDDAAVARADTVEDTNLTLLGQLEDMRAALATAEALDRSQVDGRWTAVWDRCG